MLCWLILACGAPSPDTPADPKRGDTLVVGLGLDPGNLNPVVIPYSVSFALSDLINPGLARRINEFEPAMAESWQWSDDGTTLTYQLRDGLRWEDGTPVTSHDVAFTWSLIADPAVASNWHGAARHIEDVKALDARTVRYHFRARRNPVLQQGLTVQGVVSRALFASLDPATLRGHATARRPFASGPFRLEAWEPNQRVVLVPNPHAPADWKPHLDRIIVRIIPEYATRLIELERGGIDLLTEVEVSDIDRLNTLPHVRVVRSPASSMTYLGYNLRRPPFDDLRVREALTLAINRDQLLERMLSANGEVYGSSCVGTVSPLFPDWVPQDLQPLPYDPTAAAQRLAAAGFRDTDGDGWLDRDGQPFQFTVIMQTGSPESQQLGVWLQAQLQQVKVKLHLELVEPTRFSELARAHDFDAILWGFGANPVVDPSVKWRSDGQYNWMGLADPEIDALIDVGVGADSVQSSQEAFREVQRRVYAAQPATFLYWRDDIIAMDRRFRDTQLDNRSMLRHAERWWVPPEERKY